MDASDLLSQLRRLLGLEQAGYASPPSAPGGFLADADMGPRAASPVDPAQVDAMIAALLADADDAELAAALERAGAGREGAWLADEARRRGLGAPA